MNESNPNQLNYEDLTKLVDQVIEYDSALSFNGKYLSAKKAIETGKSAIIKLQSIGFLDKNGDVIVQSKLKDPVLKKLFKYFVDNAG